jgi:hypothetical protein
MARWTSAKAVDLTRRDAPAVPPVTGGAHLARAIPAPEGVNAYPDCSRSLAQTEICHSAQYATVTLCLCRLGLGLLHDRAPRKMI